MITAMEIDGFKTFHQFNLTLAPFQVIVGANGVGKSNLFDALKLLARLADEDLRSAFQNLRGEAGELFASHANGQAANRIRLAVELLLEQTIQDSWGAEASLKYPRLRYELEIDRHLDDRGLERLYVAYEALSPIRRREDTWLKLYAPALSTHLPKVTGGRPPFISTAEENGQTSIALHQDGRSGRKNNVAGKLERTILSGVANTEFPHVFAAREAIRSWQFLHLNPEQLRQPSSMLAHTSMASDGRNLPTTLARLKASDPYLIKDISRDLANLVPGILSIDVREDTARREYIIWAKMQDGREFSSRVLSDGTLRLLALITLKYDPEHRGVLCFEEPENGVHPARLKHLVEILAELATDFNDDAVVYPMRQLLVNTHSPILVSQNIVRSNLLFATTITSVDPSRSAPPQRLTQIRPVEADTQMKLALNIPSAEERYTLTEVIRYLESDDLALAQQHFAEQIDA